MRLLSTSLVLAVLLTTALHAQPQIGGSACTNASLSGVYYYLINGTVNSYGPYVELAKLVADGQGNVTGGSYASIGGSGAPYTLSGTYTIQSNCSGSIALSANSQKPSTMTFQVVNGGQGLLMAYTISSGVIMGRGYRTTAGTTPIKCATASLSGNYAFLLSGSVNMSGTNVPYSQVGDLVGDGLGSMSVTGMGNVGGNTAAGTGSGVYSVASDCSGTAAVTNQFGTANYYIAVVEDGQAALFLEADYGYGVGGVALPASVPPQNAVVNAADYDPKALAPGEIFTIFGQGLPQSAASAQVTVNGEAAPVFFANGTQVNAEIPFDVPAGAPVTVSVSGGGTSSNTVLVNLHQAGPGVFVYGNNRGVVQNQDYSLNTPDNPAKVGDYVIAYLTGPGAVSPAVATGTAAPLSPLSYASAPYSVAIGGSASPDVPFLGLTPGFMGLYQANAKVPSLAPGDYPIVVTVAGAASNGPIISIR